MFKWGYLRFFSSDTIRNIGIIAHIDAGKTTTTERMLYFAGRTRRLGEVHRGDTVTDFLPEERERGITISSAAITFRWPPPSPDPQQQLRSLKQHQITLVDTPGHVDFTMEVERSLRVLDGAVVILDGSAGVQAQTRKVWRQASKYNNIPRLIFINKLDKVGADFEGALADAIKCFHPTNENENILPIPIQEPIYEKEGVGGEDRLVGLVDLLSGNQLIWTDPSGKEYSRKPLEDSKWKVKRTQLTEKLAELDEILLEKYINLADEGRDQVESRDLIEAIRRLTIQSKICPVLCGSSFKNIGVQPLLDGIVNFLPNSAERPLPHIYYADQKEKRPDLYKKIFQSDTLIALAFKVVYDDQRGFMTYVRIYQGSLRLNLALWNTSQNVKERPTRMYRALANQFEEMEEATEGNVIVLLGLRHTRTGDTLTNNKNINNSKEYSNFYLEPISTPLPVFTLSIKPNSRSEEGALDEALSIVSIEDPSLRISKDLETEERQLSGMGELHLEIVGKRITRDLRVKAQMGPIRIAYKETLKNHPEECHLSEPVRDMEGNVHSTDANTKNNTSNMTRNSSSNNNILATLHLAVEQSTDGNTANTRIEWCLNDVSESVTSSKILDQEGLKECIEDGINRALSEGPTAKFPLLGLVIKVSKIDLQLESSSISADSFRRAAHRSLRRHFRSFESCLVEPYSAVEITIPTSSLGPIVSDIHGARRGHVLETNCNSSSGSDEGNTVIKAEVPTETILGYATWLRSKTGGMGEFTMEPLEYRVMSMDQQIKVLKRLCLYTVPESNGEDNLEADA